MKSTVGVVIPAYNAASFIEESLESVARQDRSVDFITVVDDGSSDGTSAAVEKWMRARPSHPVLLIRQQNTGISGARNRGIEMTPSDCIATLDADDLWEQGHVSALMRPLEREPGIVVSFGDAREFSNEGTAPQTLLERVGPPSTRLPLEPRGEYQLLGGSVFRSLLHGSYLPVSGTVFRRDAAIKAGLFDTTLSHVEDRDFHLRMSRLGRYAFVPRVVCAKRQHEGNISHPKNYIFMARGAFHVAVLTARREKGATDPEDRNALAKAVTRTARHYLYIASLSGILATRRARGLIRQLGVSVTGGGRAWLRALWYEIVGHPMHFP